MSPSEKKELAELVARSCRVLGKLDLTHGALGHVSYHLEGSETMLIKGKGPEEVGLRYTAVEDVLEVDFDANTVSGPEGLQPPSESFIHIWLYRRNPELRSVIHIHPEHAVLLTICDKPILPIYGAYGSGARLAIDGVPTFPRSITISTPALGQQFADFTGDKRAVLMRGHGATVSGTSVEDATVRSLALNELVTMMYKAHLLGEPKAIPDEDIEEMSRQRADPGPRRRGSAGGELGMLATWRYYCSLAGESP